MFETLFTATEDLLKKQKRDTYLNAGVAAVLVALLVAALVIYRQGQKDRLDLREQFILREETRAPEARPGYKPFVYTKRTAGRRIFPPEELADTDAEQTPEIKEKEFVAAEIPERLRTAVTPGGGPPTPVTPGMDTFLGPGLTGGASAVSAGGTQADVQDCAFGIHVPFSEAVSCFIETIAGAAAKIFDTQTEQDTFAAYEEDVRSRLPEFLGDLILIADRLEEEGTPDFVFAQYAAFAEKWNEIVYAYPDLNVLEPVLNPIMDELLEGLPQLEKKIGDNPLENLFEYYQAMFELDPWGTGSFFALEPLPQEEKLTTLSELSREKTVNGVKTIEVINREILTTLNGVTVYFELVINGQVVSKFVEFRNPTLVHDVLAQMIVNGEDPVIIGAVSELTQIMDANLELALDNGILDECSLSFINRKETFGSVDDCTDAIGEKQSLGELVKFDPFDQVNQLDLQARRSDAPLPEAEGNTVLLKEYSAVTEKTAGIWFLGVLLPTYVWSMVSLIRFIV